MRRIPIRVTTARAEIVGTATYGLETLLGTEGQA